MSNGQSSIQVGLGDMHGGQGGIQGGQGGVQGGLGGLMRDIGSLMQGAGRGGGSAAGSGMQGGGGAAGTQGGVLTGMHAGGNVVVPSGLTGGVGGMYGGGMQGVPSIGMQGGVQGMDAGIPMKTGKGGKGGGAAVRSKSSPEGRRLAGGVGGTRFLNQVAPGATQHAPYGSAGLPGDGQMMGDGSYGAGVPGSPGLLYGQGGGGGGAPMQYGSGRMDAQSGPGMSNFSAPGDPNAPYQVCSVVWQGVTESRGIAGLEAGLAARALPHSHRFVWVTLARSVFSKGL